MIPQTLRLTKPRIAYILLKGKKINFDHLTGKFLPSQDSASHFCVVVSSKTAPLAVNRNRLRRQAYEIIRLNHALLARPCDLVIICKKTAANLVFQDLQQNINKLFKAIH